MVSYPLLNLPDFAGKIKDAVTGHHDKKDVAETK